MQNVRGFTESAWSGAGSGCNLWQAKPSYQTDTGCTGRSYADISADADPNTGMQVYDTDDGGWVVVGGTSEASPLIAAYTQWLGLPSQGPAWAYANDTLLNDPSSGSNGTCAATISYICNAGPGYDGPTGVGSISGAVAAGAPGHRGPWRQRVLHADRDRRPRLNCRAGCIRTDGHHVLVGVRNDQRVRPDDHAERHRRRALTQSR